MRAVTPVLIVLMLAACGPKAPPEQPAEPAPAASVAAPPPEPAPLSMERTALCTAAVDAFKALGLAHGPEGASAEAVKRGETLLNMRGMELELADAASFKKLHEGAEAAWKDKTPAEIEAAASACLKEIGGGQ